MTINFNSLEGVLKQLVKSVDEKAYVKFADIRFSLLVNNKINKTAIDVVADKIFDAIKAENLENRKLEQLHELTAGMETLKTRISNFKESIFCIRRFFLEIFGYFTPLNVATKKLQEAIDVVEMQKGQLAKAQKSETLKQELAELKKQAATLAIKKQALVRLEADIANKDTVVAKIAKDRAALLKLQGDKANLNVAPVKAAQRKVEQNKGTLHKLTNFSLTKSPQLQEAEAELGRAMAEFATTEAYDAAIQEFNRLDSLANELEFSTISANDQFVEGHEGRVKRQALLLAEISAIEGAVAQIGAKEAELRALNQ